MTFEEQWLEAIAWSARLHQTLRADRGDVVELRRLLAPSPVPTRAYWRLNPPRWVWPEELPMWLAGLAAHVPRSVAAPNEQPERPGAALRRAHRAIERNGLGSARAFEREVSKLLTCHPEDVHREIVPVVQLASRAGVRLHYGLLLYDLAHWGSTARYVQRGWARDFWGPSDRPEADTNNEEHSR
jgi:CRISPR type I-E-associated protein CasB/Cse2